MKQDIRITTGKYKGRMLATPEGIRPTQEKVRKAIFDILGDIEGLTFLELFAGSGAVGFEALSRGVRQVVLVENNRNCVRVLTKNIESLKAFDAKLYPIDTEKAIGLLHKEGRSFDIVFLDPPYNKGTRSRNEDRATSLSGQMSGNKDESWSKKTLQMAGACDILPPNGLLVIQHFKKDDLPDKLGDLILFKQAVYGDTVLSFYRKKGVLGLTR